MKAPYPARYVTHRSQTLPLIISNEGSLPSKVCHTNSSQTLPLISSSEGSLPSKVCHPQVTRPYHSSALVRAPYPARYVIHSSPTLPLISSSEGSVPSKFYPDIQKYLPGAVSPNGTRPMDFPQIADYSLKSEQILFYKPEFYARYSTTVTTVLAIQNLTFLHGDQRWS